MFSFLLQGTDSLSGLKQLAQTFTPGEYIFTHMFSPCVYILQLALKVGVVEITGSGLFTVAVGPSMMCCIVLLLFFHHMWEDILLQKFT